MGPWQVAKCWRAALTGKEESGGLASLGPVETKQYQQGQEWPRRAPALLRLPHPRQRERRFLREAKLLLPDNP